METITTNILIQRSVEDIFQFIINDKNDALWQPGVLEAEILTAEPFGVGSKFRQVFLFLGKHIDLTFEVTCFEINSRFGFKTISGPLPVEGEYNLVPALDGTILTFFFTASTGNLFKLAEPILAEIAQSQWKTSLIKLKELLDVHK